ncbi:MAG: peroxide stress protein YaaA [Methyloversatilis sp.]|uniref:peroxide stress protein YaaA n=1 Tax=Methyloversatilis sp. TaxID=2569862 RepID=UPI002734D104|nr:peroxide stress protein YaaA [Methyloversatilis sp.]MDP3873138.1 peroxide stress protein YaaA [Methyloversatilis sp.]
MIIVLSPAKSLDYESTLPAASATRPDFLDRSAVLVDILKSRSPAALASLMSISEPLAALNAARYADWTPDYDAPRGRPAALAFNGDVYDGLDARSLDRAGLDWLQQHVRILSGLYGVLRPLDLMLPYRLEMSTRLVNPSGRDLYAFWGELPTQALNALLENDSRPVLVNLASDEYFKAVKRKTLKAEVIQPVFQDWKGGTYKVISFFAKRARGLMARYAADHRIDDVEALRDFAVDGYAFDVKASSDTQWIYRRRLA